MNFKKEKIIIFTLVIILLLETFYSYFILPSEIATHWNAAGVVDGYSTKINRTYYNTDNYNNSYRVIFVPD
ncbi:MAG: DUF1648 domain-containing protein [Nanoarchaeota archaeon]|nr:DUF1648 domain-containing protein [Nanoarchaeota archaeon]